MTNGVFKPLDGFAYARATKIMSTESVTDFEWSVKLIGTGYMTVGIASQSPPKMSQIYESDKNAILYANMSSTIKTGSNTIHASLRKHQTGDIICFRFQPHVKKLVIYFVRKYSWNNLIQFSLSNSQFKNGRYEVDLKDGVKYSPVVQTAYQTATEIHFLDP